MAHIVVLGAGLGGSIMAYEMHEHLRKKEDRLTVINKGPIYNFIPSNPWVAVGWRTPEEISVDMTPAMKKKKIDFRTEGAKRVHPDKNAVELENGNMIEYDYLIIATGPELAFDEIEGFGPEGHTISVCQTDHAAKAREVVEKLAANPGPVIIGAVQGASCFGPAYEFAMIIDTELKRRKIRDKVQMTFVTSEPYIGHLGLDGVGDTKGMLESELRDRYIKWVTNARVQKFDEGMAHIEELDENGEVKKNHVMPFNLCMMLPPFRGVPAVRGIDKLVNPRGFVLIDEYQRNPHFRNIFSIGVCVAIPPIGKTPVPVGVPKTGFMIESMVTATALNIAAELKGEPANHQASWNAVCLADFGNSGVAFVAQPQIPPRNLNWSSKGKWVHLAKIQFERYFLKKVRKGISMPFYEKLGFKLVGINKIKKG